MIMIELSVQSNLSLTSSIDFVRTQVSAYASIEFLDKRKHKSY